jgi:hypothetical protein
VVQELVIDSEAGGATVVVAMVVETLTESV